MVISYLRFDQRFQTQLDQTWSTLILFMLVHHRQWICAIFQSNALVNYNYIIGMLWPVVILSYKSAVGTMSCQVQWGRIQFLV